MGNRREQGRAEGPVTEQVFGKDYKQLSGYCKRAFTALFLQAAVDSPRYFLS
jgi:hypothetical protein